ncbi:MAG: sec-independent translocase [Mycobacteriales bacterium]
MFNSLGWGEVLILLLVGLVIFGPEKLPQLTKDAAKVLRQVRGIAQGARTQLKSELGPEFGDIDFQSLNPKSFVRKHLLEDFDDPFGEDDDEPAPAERADSATATDSPAGQPAAAGTAAAGAAATTAIPVGDGARPQPAVATATASADGIAVPYDMDAT